MKTDTLQVRLQSEEKQAFGAAADLAGLAVSAWVRERLRSAARRELTDAGIKVSFFTSAQDRIS